MKKLPIYLLIVILSLTLYGCAGLADFEIDLSGGYQLVRSSADYVYVYSGSSTVIPKKVIEIAWDDDYILAKQLGLKRKYPDNPNNTTEIPDESKVNYWIIDINKSKVYGPLTDKDFTEKKKELSISGKLVLKKVSYYKK